MFLHFLTNLSNQDTHIDIFHVNICTWHISLNVTKCHEMTSYCNLWHLPHDKKCYELCQFGYRKNCPTQQIGLAGFDVLKMLFLTHPMISAPCFLLPYPSDQQTNQQINQQTNQPSYRWDIWSHEICRLLSL